MSDRNPELWFGADVAAEGGERLGTCTGILLDGDGVETWLVVRPEGLAPELLNTSAPEAGVGEDAPPPEPAATSNGSRTAGGKGRKARGGKAAAADKEPAEEASPSARVVPIAGAERTDGVVHTPYPADVVLGGPAFPPDVMILTEAERAALRTRYGLRSQPEPDFRAASPGEPIGEAGVPAGVPAADGEPAAGDAALPSPGEVGAASAENSGAPAADVAKRGRRTWVVAAVGTLSAVGAAAAVVVASRRRNARKGPLSRK